MKSLKDQNNINTSRSKYIHINKLFNTKEIKNNTQYTNNFTWLIEYKMLNKNLNNNNRFNLFNSIIDNYT